MKKTYKILTLILILLLVCGCDKKHSLNKEEMTKALYSNGFIITDITDRMEDDDITAVLVANNSKYSIEYYKFKDNKSALESFENNKEVFQNYSKDGKEKSKDNYNTFSQEIENKYNSLTRVDNTLIYASINNEYRSDLNKILKNIGY